MKLFQDHTNIVKVTNKKIINVYTALIACMRKLLREKTIVTFMDFAVSVITKIYHA